MTFADLSLQLGKLSAEEGHVNMSTLREISQLQKTMVGFRGSMERYRVKVQSESGCEGRPLMKQGSLVKLSRTGKATRYLLLVRYCTVPWREGGREREREREGERERERESERESERE